MLTPGPDVQVYVAPGATDMRKSFDTLAELVLQAVGGNPLSGNLFAFCNRRRDRMKVLYWDGSGLCLLAKRLERGRFAWPKPREGEGSLRMTSDELTQLLGGLDVARPRKRGWYDWHRPTSKDVREKARANGTPLTAECR